MSWIIANKETGEAVVEIFNKETLEHLNTQKYSAIPAREYLEELNSKTKEDHSKRGWL